jgi:diguanylate cyclase (GGDEF)-like protein/PAS domain S-box-containing protein
MKTLRFQESKKIYAMVFSALIILIFSCFIVTKEFNDRDKIYKSVLHTYTVMTTINTVALSMEEVEKQLQIFIYTHDKKNTTLYDNAIKATQNNLSKVKKLTIDDVNQQIRINDIEQKLNKIVYLNNNNSLTQLNQNEQSINKILSLINMISIEELSILKQRTQKFEHVRYVNYFETIACILLGYLFLFISFISLIKLANKNEQFHLLQERLEREKLLLKENQRIELEFSLNAAKLGFWNLNLVTLTADRSLLHDQIFGYPSLLPEWTLDIFLTHVHPDDHSKVVQSFKNLSKNNGALEFECRIYRFDDKSLHWIWVSGKIVHQSEYQHMLGVVQDITERKLMESLLFESEERWKFALENAQHGVWDWRIPEKVVYFSHYWKRMLGYNDDEIKNEQSQFESLVHPDDLNRVWKAINEHFDQKTEEYLCEVRFRCKDGSYKWILDRGKVISRAEDGTVLRAIGTHTDISDLKDKETSLKNLAEHDTLTGLVNRTIFEDRLDQAILLAKRNKAVVAVFFIDIDGFKRINDVFGHAIGDLVLRTSATRLQKSIRSMDTCARYGGDEFLLLLNNIKEEEDVIKIAKEIINKFSKEFELDDKKLNVTLSIGISLYPKDGESSLIDKADKAMYFVKSRGKNNYKLYDERDVFKEAKPKTWS